MQQLIQIELDTMRILGDVACCLWPGACRSCQWIWSPAPVISSCGLIDYWANIILHKHYGLWKNGMGPLGFHGSIWPWTNKGTYTILDRQPIAAKTYKLWWCATHPSSPQHSPLQAFLQLHNWQRTVEGLQVVDCAPQPGISRWIWCTLHVYSLP